MLKKWGITIGSLILVATVFSVLFYTLGQSQLSNESENRESVFQIGAFNTFAQGDFDGKITYSELVTHGDFGIGTLDGLDGEMVTSNGVFFQIPINGKPRQINSAEETPFAIVTFFEADQTLYLPESINYSELKAHIDNVISPEKAIYALKIHGVYDYAKTRSVPIQTPPYPH